MAVKLRRLGDRTRIVGGLLSLCVVGELLSGVAARALEFPPTQNRGAPSRTAGGGVRGEGCLAKEMPALTAIAPANNVMTTTAAQPSVWVYLPTAEVSQGEFSLFDEETDERVYLAEVTLPQTAGIIRLQLPSSMTLEPQKTYRWRFTVVCDPMERSGDRSVRGWVERVPLDLAVATRLKTLDEAKKAELYARSGLWPETLAIAADLRTQAPEAWESLLKSVGLEAMVAQPFVAEITLPATSLPTAGEP